MSLDAPRPPAPSVPSLAVRFVDVHSGRGARFETFEDVTALVDCVVRRVEGTVTGRRFPLLRVVAGRRPLSGTECEALVWELARVRTILATIAAPAAGERADVPPSSVVPPPIVAGRRSLADLHAATLLALDHTARLGAASRRGARFEAADGGLDGAVVVEPRSAVQGR